MTRSFEVDVMAHELGGFIGKLYRMDQPGGRALVGAVGAIEPASNGAGGRIFANQDEVVAYAKREARLALSRRTITTTPFSVSA